ncbi:methionyl-tRNA formyltransferase [Spiroplasma sabaudiense Ar-1343]|uniref:Methionyl-tRNA formyltransferase n=1 Tax=Spiroplasma sabaudiense Ar-1343 TaxID=1276257 RepID=W6A9B6_9MOLU|nr:methionyl-tRNA formyltransferase [Spiroplasma sabaudiense]AHI53708.1 methionyl-tRNA formyltransferase [Spiroplasma sabaudiense Ar-1343]
MKKKLIFFGTPEIAVKILGGINLNDFELIAIVTQPDKKYGRKQELKPSPVKEFAINNNIKVLQPLKVIEIFEEIKEMKPDLLLTCAYGQMIPTKILELVSGMAINVHASLLPKYRGGSPIQYALLNGDKTTGISLMQMIKEMDAGDFYVQESIDILQTDDCESLFEKLGFLGKEMVQKYLLKIVNKEILPIAQNEKLVSFAPKITSEMEKINFNLSAAAVINQIRAFAPTPGAFGIINNERYKILKARLLSEKEIFPMTLTIKRNGEVIYFDKEGFIVYTNFGMIKVLEIQRQGKTKISAGNYFVNKLKDIQIGMIFNESEAKINL